jgi:hypothetical protein
VIGWVRATERVAGDSVGPADGVELGLAAGEGATEGIEVPGSGCATALVGCGAGTELRGAGVAKGVGSGVGVGAGTGVAISTAAARAPRLSDKGSGR